MSLPPVTAPYLAAITLLGAAGVAKAIRPAETANALAGAGLSVGPGWVRAGAVAEASLAVAAFVLPGPVTGGLVALAYVLFAAFIVVALQRGWALTSCGCFGRPDSPPTVAHAVLNAGAAACAVWWAAATATTAPNTATSVVMIAGPPATDRSTPGMPVQPRQRTRTRAVLHARVDGKRAEPGG